MSIAAKHIMIKNAEIRNGQRDGISIGNAAFVTIQDSYIHNFMRIENGQRIDAHCIVLNTGTSQTTTDIKIYRNRIERCSGDGIQIYGVTGQPVGFNNMILPLESHGVKVISMGFFVPEETPVIWRGPMLHKAIEQFLGDVYWGDLDFLLADLPPGLFQFLHLTHEDATRLIGSDGIDYVAFTGSVAAGHAVMAAAAGDARKMHAAATCSSVGSTRSAACVSAKSAR